MYVHKPITGCPKAQPAFPISLPIYQVRKDTNQEEIAPPHQDRD